MLNTKHQIFQVSLFPRKKKKKCNNLSFAALINLTAGKLLIYCYKPNCIHLTSDEGKKGHQILFIRKLYYSPLPLSKKKYYYVLPTFELHSDHVEMF